MDYKTVIKYIIMEIDSEGRLKNPQKNYYGRSQCIFNEYGYKSEEEAIKDIEINYENSHSNKLIIIKTFERNYNYNLEEEL